MNTPTSVAAALTGRVKAATVRAMTGSRLAQLCLPLTRDAAVVFMLHRFADRGKGVLGDDPAIVRELLAYLRRERYRLVDLRTLFASLRGEAPPLRRAVAFTIDDGYEEHATVAAPLFADFDCPVTTFVTTGFLDGVTWFWWDRIRFVFAHATQRTVSVELPDATVTYPLDDPLRRYAAQEDFTNRCKALPEQDKHEAIEQLAAVTGVPLPQQPPEPYRPMSWHQLRAAERLGMTFGPHTITHPVLARTTEPVARAEITGSWIRLCAEAVGPIPIFAYPNGQEGDFGQRELDILQDSGLIGAVTGMPGFATTRRYRSDRGAFLVPRVVFPSSLPYLIQQVCGLERLKSLLRGSV